MQLFVPTLLITGLLFTGIPTTLAAPAAPLDPKAEINDLYAFVSYNILGPTTPSKVTIIMSVDHLAEPAIGPRWLPFDPDILYEIHADNNNDAIADVTFQFRFATEQRLPNLYQAYVGAGTGINAPSNSPPPVPAGTLIIPPKITSFDSPGLGQRQSYTVTMLRSGAATPLTENSGGTLFAVPANVGPRTMDYNALFNQATYSITNGLKVFAGTTDDAYWADLGGLFDTLNFRSAVNGGVLTPVQDAANANVASDMVSGYAVNSIAIEVPTEMLTSSGQLEPATSPAATIGIWATTSRPEATGRRPPDKPSNENSIKYHQVARIGNPLINTLWIGMGYKDDFNMAEPQSDSQFTSFFLDPTLARVLNAATGGAISIPTPPRIDVLPLLTYAPPIAATGTTPGPVADLLRLNTGVPATSPASASRLGRLGGDPAGYPNGRRLFDDVTDITLRIVTGVLNTNFNIAPNNRLGDGVNVNDAPYRTTFPYLADCPSGRDRRHIDPAEPGCTAGAGAPCTP